MVRREDGSDVDWVEMGGWMMEVSDDSPRGEVWRCDAAGVVFLTIPRSKEIPTRVPLPIASRSRGNRRNKSS